MEGPLLLRALMQAPAIIALVRGPRHEFVFANDAYRKVAGVRHDPTGQPFPAGGTIVADQEIRALLDRVRATGEPVRASQYLLRLTRDDGSVATGYFDFAFIPVRDGSGAVDGILIHAVDITECVEEHARFELHREQLVRQRDALRGSESRLRRIMESNMCGMIFWDEQGRIVDANDAFLEIVGYTRDDLVAGRFDALETFPPEFLEVQRRAHAELAARGVCTPYEKAYIRKDGTHVPVLVGGARFTGDDATGGGVGFVLDLRERKRMEAQLLELQRLETVGVLAGGVVHDLKNLLAIVLANVALLRIEALRGGRSTASHDMIEDASRRADALARQLLGFAGGSSPLPGPIDLSKHVRAIADLVRASIPKNISVHLDLDGDLPPTLVDAGQLQQVVMNLLVNASEAIGSRDGSLRIATTKTAGDHVCLLVSDTGGGMSEETRARIFEPFFSTKGSGRGLGLAAAAAIVRAHGAHIDVQSTLGEGTTFRVLFPVAREQPQA